MKKIFPLFLSCISHAFVFAVAMTKNTSLGPSSSNSGPVTYVEIVSSQKETVGFQTQPLKQQKLLLAKSDIKIKRKKTDVFEKPAQKLGKNTKSDLNEGNAVAGGSAGFRDEKSIYILGLRNLIESQKSYPTKAYRMGVSGTVVVQIDLDASGFFESVKLAKSSTQPVLDSAALLLVKNIRSYRSFPDSLGLNEMRVMVPLEYVIH